MLLLQITQLCIWGAFLMKMVQYLKNSIQKIWCYSLADVLENAWLLKYSMVHRSHTLPSPLIKMVQRERNLQSSHTAFSEPAGEKGNQSNLCQEMGWNWCLISRFISFSPQLHPNLHIRGDHFSCSQPWRSRQVWANQTPLSFRAKGRYCCRLCSVMLCLHLPAICCLPHLVICMYRSISEPATALGLTCPTLQLSKSSHLQVVWYPQRFRPLQQPFYPCGFQVQVLKPSGFMVKGLL